MQDASEPTTQKVRARMEVFIAIASERTDIDPTDLDAIDRITKTFTDTLTPKEIGFLLHEDPEPLSLQEVDSETREKYRAKYGTKNLKRGKFFKLKCGVIIFITHEHNLKFKIGR